MCLVCITEQLLTFLPYCGNLIRTHEMHAEKIVNLDLNYLPIAVIVCCWLIKFIIRMIELSDNSYYSKFCDLNGNSEICNIIYSYVCCLFIQILLLHCSSIAGQGLGPRLGPRCYCRLSWDSMFDLVPYVSDIY